MEFPLVDCLRICALTLSFVALLANDFIARNVWIFTCFSWILLRDETQTETDKAVALLHSLCFYILGFIFISLNLFNLVTAEPINRRTWRSTLFVVSKLFWALLLFLWVFVEETHVLSLLLWHMERTFAILSRLSQGSLFIHGKGYLPSFLSLDTRLQCC